MDEVKSQDSPPTQPYVTEAPPTHPTQRLQDGKAVNEINGAAVYRNPEASITSLLMSYNEKKWNTTCKVEIQ